ncbi:MAG: peptide chain release factor N(5)-glutamine methyltransferase [Bacteroidia bacterium]|nr:peptide chain release factor N(5)-glutamine methyltransferase [Bacteroidia bacterium]MDW8157778.1 peptide chain release factor N(5)-glutamine methyltransferase [Bacteroidia bacterium]
MFLLEFFNYGVEQLTALYAPSEARALVNILIASFLNLQRHEIFLLPRRKLSENEFQQLTHALHRLLSAEPLQYILGQQAFYGVSLFVNSSVLIPRPETEELVAIALAYVKSPSVERPISILDIGTGSGCIAIVLAKSLPHAVTFALDNNLTALQIAAHNAQKHNVKISFLYQDIFHAYCYEFIAKYNSEFDVIISNPPYVPFSEKKQLHPNIYFEPSEAIFVADDQPITFYERITYLATKLLKKNGYLFLECHPSYIALIAQYLMEQLRVKIKIQKDINQKQRFIIAQKL